MPDIAERMSPARILEDARANGSSDKTAQPIVDDHTNDGFGTRAIHVGSEPSTETGAVIPAISLSTTYKQESVGVHKGYEYTRSGNPNRDALERTLTAIEAGAGQALAFASGSSATATLLQSLGPGAHVLSVNDVYGGTFRYMTKVAAQNQGLEVDFVELEGLSENEIRSHVRPNTKLIWIETPSNPTLRVLSIPTIAHVARTSPSQPLLLVDSTFQSPFFAAPILAGADIVVHSLTKYINGHSDVLAGVILLPSSPTHDAFAAKLRFLQNAIGAVPSAYDCWLAQRGAKTLHLRMKAHGENALLVARTLASSSYVDTDRIAYPGLASHPRHALAWEALAPVAKRWVSSLQSFTGAEGDFPYGGMLSFHPNPRVFTTPEQQAAFAHAFLGRLRLFTLAESLGGVESLSELPALMTHASIPEAERAKLGISEGMVRLSVGVEEGEDLVADVVQALEHAAEDVLGSKKATAVAAA